MTQPTVRPERPFFSSGPCSKRPGWSWSCLEGAVLGRSHRSGEGKAKLKAVIDETKALLGIPDDYRVGIVPASDTGAVEMALWSLLGERGVDMLAWESFGKGWVTDVQKQLKLDDVRVLEADYGLLPDLAAVDCDRDVVFTWNGTTSGVKVPNGDWIAANRAGLTICDATSAVFAMELPWDKLDVTTWSWQKVLGGEGAHGMIVLSPRAVERLENYVPSWPLPKIFRMTKGGKLIDGIFKGETINTPSMMAVEDVLDALEWAKSIGGLKEMIARSEKNLKAVANWVEQTEWIDFLCADPATRSNTAICLKLSDACVLDGEERSGAPKKISQLLDKEGVAFDINGYRDAPAGLRLWGGATVEPADMEALMPWLDWAYGEVSGV
ncbi:phosphoserine transaminase [Aestuariispira insulae]|uniref:phosphoserine transaminase n=1 Tax=Aestuariispira insulae TaxID=1461337 RepID=A0A3D9HW22_9PROT|nr:phosphoserine transaminase [Aestuariispira insulae]RED53692.1 phosphoserine aminotransferase [Aestuariispira insulae]